MSQYKISKKRLAQIIKEEYQNLQELEDPRSPSPMSYEYEGAADDFRKQIMNLVLQLGPLTLEPKLANAVEIEIRDVTEYFGYWIQGPMRPRLSQTWMTANRETNLKKKINTIENMMNIERERQTSIDRERKKSSGR